MSATTGERSLRERLISAAVELTSQRGWAGMTMARLAAEVGVSRQTVYNEFGAKENLAEAMVLNELGRFLELVESAFAAHRGDLVESVRAAVVDVLTMSAQNPLLRAALASRQGAETDLLPLLTTHSEPLLDMARDLIRGHVEAFDLGFDDPSLEGLIDLVVRTVLSHVVRPGASPQETADALAWVVSRVID